MTDLWGAGVAEGASAGVTDLWGVGVTEGGSAGVAGSFAGVAEGLVCVAA